MMSRKRLLLFTFFFSVLVVSLFYYVFPSIVYPLRKDAIPSDAYLVPWMKPNPSIEQLNIYSVDSPPWYIEPVMMNALTLDATFIIRLPSENRTIKGTIYVGHDFDYLYVGAKLRGMYKNPTRTPPEPLGNATFANLFVLMFDVANKGQLSFPEAGTLTGVFLFDNANWHTQAGWGSDDLLWWKSNWTVSEDYYQPKGQPAFSLRNMAVEYDNSTGTLILLFSRYLRQPGNSQVNAFQMRQGERWVVKFLVSAGYQKEGYLWTDYLVCWPKPYLYNSPDSSWWPKLVIDLTNPPQKIPGQTSPAESVMGSSTRAQNSMLLR